MASTMPSLSPGCCVPECEDPQSVAVPGPQGIQGIPGDDGTMGVSAFTTLTAQFVMPAELGSSAASVSDSSWASVNQIVFMAKADGSVVGYFLVTAIASSVLMTLKNLEDAATGAYPGNSAPASVFTIGSKIGPAGVQGPNGTASGQAAGGDLKGTYLNPKIGIGNTKGSSLWGNGTDTVAVAAGANGHLIAFDSTDAEGVKTFQGLPLTGDPNIAENRVARLSAATGLPIPVEASKVQINEPGSVAAGLIGALVLDASAGNARGTDAVDLQVNRAGAAQVASGNRSFLGAGEKNSSTGTESAVVSGDTNSATNNQSVVVGGHDNTSSGDSAFIGGGDSNNATGQESAIPGGNNNVSSGVQSCVGGGDGNTSSGDESVIAGGGSNTASAVNSTISGGKTNLASAEAAHIAGGKEAVANKYGQSAWASGGFGGGQGTAQASKLVMRNVTTNATPTELFLDGAALRCTIAAGQSWLFQISLVARTAAGLDAIYTAIGVIRNVAGTTSISAATVTEVFDGAALAPAPVAVTADDPNDALVITVTGLGGTTIRWVASVMLTEVIH